MRNLPEALGIEVVEVHILDRLDPGRLERRGAADDGEVAAAEFAEGVSEPSRSPPLPMMMRTPSRSISGRVKRSIRSEVVVPTQIAS
jgi:hypothetical protein